MLKKAKSTEDKKVGGFAFYLSIPALFFISCSNLVIMPQLWDSLAKTYSIRFLIGAGIGISIATLFQNGKLAVLMHETKHAVMSSFAGNKLKNLTVGKSTGSYRYSYTKETAHLNAMIALAPYWFPLLTLPSFLLAVTEYGDPYTLKLIIGVAFGIDITIATLDIGPHQSDLQRIRGGVNVAKIYIYLSQLATATILGAWVMQGRYGIEYLVYGMSDILWSFIH